MRKVYAGFVAQQIAEGSPIIALEADLMSSMAMDSVAREYPQHVINCGIMEANVIGTAAGYRSPDVSRLFTHSPHLPAAAALTNCLCRWIISAITSR